MIKKFLLDILIDPKTKQKLEYINHNTELTNGNSSFYNIIDDVPILLLEKDLLKKSPLHEAQKTSFDYIEHYKNDADINNYFDPNESKTTKNERQRNREAIIEKVGKNTSTILDVGCGEAWVANFFCKEKINVVSMDVASKNPITALKKYGSNYHAAVAADVFNLPFADNSFDTIIASEIIEHLYDPKLFIQNLIPLLTQNGKLIIVTPYNEILTYHTCVHCNNSTPSNAHLYSFNEKNLVNFLPENIEEYKYTVFNNKVFFRLRLYNIIQFLPYKLWKFIDKIINKIIPKASTFLIEIFKPS